MPFSSSSNYDTHRTVRQLSRKNLERQNTYYGDNTAGQSCETWSEMNYNTGCSYGDNYGDSQYGNNTTDISNGANSFPKALPQPPVIQGSQSTYDGFGYG